MTSCHTGKNHDVMLWDFIWGEDRRGGKDGKRKKEKKGGGRNILFVEKKQPIIASWMATDIATSAILL